MSVKIPLHLEWLPSHSSLHPNIRILFHLLSTHATLQLGVVYPASQGANWDEDQMVPCTHKSTTPEEKRVHFSSASKIHNALQKILCCIHTKSFLRENSPHGKKKKKSQLLFEQFHITHVKCVLT